MSENNLVDDVLLNYAISDFNQVSGVAEKLRFNSNYTHSANTTYACAEEHAEKLLSKALYSDTGDSAKRMIIVTDKALLEVSWVHGYIHMIASAASRVDALKRLEQAKKLLPKTRSANDDEIQMNFWSSGSNGPQRINRRLIVPSWAEINVNYTIDTAEKISKLMEKDYRPGAGGKLILWQGEPGTGKTTAIRALARSWKDWASFNYITDPERFFGSDAQYMYSVIMGGDEGNYDLSPRREGDKKKEEHYKLLILEDCGEIIAKDARQSSGQGLSRFLNCVDGLIGQGLNIVVLVTTNEELSELHPAVQRPGRASSRIEFDKLTPEESTEWLEDDVKKPMTIAELYAKREGTEESNNSKNKTVGFG